MKTGYSTTYTKGVTANRLSVMKELMEALPREWFEEVNDENNDTIFVKTKIITNKSFKISLEIEELED